MKMMKGLTLVLALAWIGSADAAGRAFPADSVNFIIEAFKSINRNIEWDHTNFLIDLSGRFAVCKGRHQLDSVFPVSEVTDVGESISGYVSDHPGQEGHVNAVIGYIHSVIDQWTFNTRSSLYDLVLQADYFGCSVRPKCSGRIIVVCLFSPGERNYQPLRAPSTPLPVIPPRRPDPPVVEPERPIFIQGEQKAVAFTPEQYDVAEGVMGGQWDKDHLLENLSGFETRCEMLGADKWDWSYARAEAKRRGIDIVEHFGKSRNKGETEPAMVKAMKAMKHLRGQARVGCSIIPDCMISSRMWVVVGCIEEV